MPAAFWQTRGMTTCLRHGRVAALVLLASLLGSGCSSIGPRTVQRDRADYTRAVGESWKSQILLNVVKLRYLDPPIAVDVAQIVAGYTLETDVSVGGTLEREGNNSLSLGASGRFTDRPTITYTPLTGNRFIRAALMPLPPDSVFFLIQAGWPADAVLSWAVASINGLKNQETSITGVTPASPEFLRVLELLRQIQLSGAVALRVEQNPQKQETALLGFQRQGIPQKTLDDIAEVRRLLQLNPEAQEFRLVFASTPANDHELAVVTRSPLRLMGTLAGYVEVPPEHIAEGRATPGLSAPGQLHIGCSRKLPADAYAAVNYRDRWFWIDDRDLKTKRAFGLLLLLFTLSDTGQHEPLPLITIPAQ